MSQLQTIQLTRYALDPLVVQRPPGLRSATRFGPTGRRQPMMLITICRYLARVLEYDGN